MALLRCLGAVTGLNLRICSRATRFAAIVRVVVAGSPYFLCNP